MEHDPEAAQKSWEKSEPSNLDIIGAYAPSEHLRLFNVGNSANETIHVLAASDYSAKIIAMMGGHVRSLRNARLWEPMHSSEAGSAVGNAINGRLPGKIWVYGKYAVMRDAVFYESSPRIRRALAALTADK